MPRASDVAKKSRGENTGRARQRVRRTARRHEPGTAADAETATFGLLDEHDADEGDHDQEVDDDQYRMHMSSPAPRGAWKKVCGSLHEPRTVSNPDRSR